MVRVVPDESCALAEVMLNCVPCIVIAIASRKDNNTEVHRYVFWGGHFQFTMGARSDEKCRKVHRSVETKVRNKAQRVENIESGTNFGAGQVGNLPHGAE